MEQSTNHTVEGGKVGREADSGAGNGD